LATWALPITVVALSTCAHPTSPTSTPPSVDVLNYLLGDTALWPRSGSHGQNQIVDLARRDVLAALDDQLLDASRDVEVTVLIEVTEIACAHAAVCGQRRSGRLRLVVIALHHTRRLDQDLAVFFGELALGARALEITHELLERYDVELECRGHLVVRRRGSVGHTQTHCRTAVKRGGCRSESPRVPAAV
jgi:hypothetical protein